jgi:CheY-like chemotaxis protein
MFLAEHHTISTAPFKLGASRKALTAIVDMIRPLSALNELPQRTRGITMEPARILVIDDNSRHYGQVISSLISSGYTAQIVESGDAAMTLLRQQAFDVVLLEVTTPTLDGLKVLEALKADAQTAQLPVIMMSAQNDLDVAIQCIRLGAEDFLCTPLQGALLKDRIEASLERKADRERLRTAHGDATILRSVGQLLNATLDPNRVMQIALKQAVQRLQPSAGLIGTLNNGMLTVADSFSFDELFATSKQLPLSEMGWQSVMQAERPYLTQQQVMVKDTSGLSSYTSCYIVPIKRYQRPMAAMILYNVHDSSAEAMAFVEQLAQDAALALWNATLYNSAIGCAEEYHTQINTVSREMKLASTTIKEYTSLLRFETGSVTRDMKSRMLESIRNNASHLFLLSTELDAKPTNKEAPTQPSINDCDDNRMDAPTVTV